MANLREKKSSGNTAQHRGSDLWNEPTRAFSLARNPQSGTTPRRVKTSAYEKTDVSAALTC